MVTVYAIYEGQTTKPACSDRAMAERAAFDLLHQRWTDITIDGAPIEPERASGNKGQVPLMITDTPKGWFVEMLEQIATQPALLKAAAAGDDEWDQRRRGRVGCEVGPQPSR